MPHPVLLFGHGVPLDAPELSGLALRDVTRQRHQPPASSRIADLLDPFLDPFVWSFLVGLEACAFDAAHQRDWAQGLRVRLSAGEPYAFANADTPLEVFNALGMPVVVNQWWS